MPLADEAKVPQLKPGLSYQGICQCDDAIAQTQTKLAVKVLFACYAWVKEFLSRRLCTCM